MVLKHDVNSVRRLGAEEMALAEGGVGARGHSLPGVAFRNPHSLDEAYVLKARVRRMRYYSYDAARVSKLEVSYKLWEPVRVSYSLTLAAARTF